MKHGFVVGDNDFAERLQLDPKKEMLARVTTVRWHTSDTVSCHTVRVSGIYPSRWIEPIIGFETSYIRQGLITPVRDNCTIPFRRLSYTICFEQGGLPRPAGVVLFGSL